MASIGFYDDDIINEVKSKSDIVSVISEYVGLRKAGRGYLGLCPFHQEKTPSFNVDPDKQFFYCFGCGTGGNVFTFLMKKTGLSFPEALKLLADRAGVRLPESRGGSSKERKLNQRLRAALAFAATKYTEQLNSKRGEEAQKYLEKRGFSKQTIDKFQLGFAPDEWDFMATLGKRMGVEMADLERSGLVAARTSGGFYDRFRNRIMFPIWNSSGDPIGFGGRALGDDPAKYLNSPETPLFRKGKELYALNLAKPSIRTNEKVLLVEGYMDVISCFEHGIDFAVAGMGTALTSEQARTLLLLTQNIYLAYDQDEAGGKAARRTIDLFRDLGGRSSVVMFEGAKDPDEFLRTHGASLFRERMDKALLDIGFIYEQTKRSLDASTIQGKLEIQRAIVPVLGSLESEFERSVYTEEISRDLGVGKDSLHKDVELYKRKDSRATRYKKGDNRDTTGYDNQRKPGSGRDYVKAPATLAGTQSQYVEENVTRRKAEEGIIRCLVEKPALFDSLKGELCQNDISDVNCRLAFSILKDGSIAEENDGLLAWMAELCIRFGPVTKPERILKDCLRRLQEIQLTELMQKMAEAERKKDQEALMTIQGDYQRLLKQVKSVGGTG